jgi:hypothetical protein
MQTLDSSSRNDAGSVPAVPVMGSKKCLRVGLALPAHGKDQTLEKYMILARFYVVIAVGGEKDML